MNSYISDVLEGTLEQRYPVGFSQEIADRVKNLAERDIQYLDIKELNDLAVEYRHRLRGLIAQYRVVKEGIAPAMIRRVYASHESIFIRRQITDLWQVYRIIMADSHEMTADYLAQLNAKNYRASPPHRGGDLPGRRLNLWSDVPGMFAKSIKKVICCRKNLFAISLAKTGFVLCH